MNQRRKVNWQLSTRNRRIFILISMLKSLRLTLGVKKLLKVPSLLMKFNMRRLTTRSLWRSLLLPLPSHPSSARHLSPENRISKDSKASAKCKMKGTQLVSLKQAMPEINTTLIPTSREDLNSIMSSTWAHRPPKLILNRPTLVNLSVKSLKKEMVKTMKWMSATS